MTGIDRPPAEGVDQVALRGDTLEDDVVLRAPELVADRLIRLLHLTIEDRIIDHLTQHCGGIHQDHQDAVTDGGLSGEILGRQCTGRL